MLIFNLFRFLWFKKSCDRRADTRQDLKDELALQRELANVNRGSDAWLEAEMRAVRAAERRQNAKKPGRRRSPHVS